MLREPQRPPHLSNAVLVAQNNANCRRREALLCELSDILLNLHSGTGSYYLCLRLLRTVLATRAQLASTPATICHTSVIVVFSHEAGDRLYGRDERLLPLPLLCMRPMVEASCAQRLCVCRTKRTGAHQTTDSSCSSCREASSSSAQIRPKQADRRQGEAPGSEKPCKGFMG